MKALSFMMIGFVIGYVTLAITINAAPAGGGYGSAVDADRCPDGYYCMKMADKDALQTFIDTRCTKLDHGKY